MAKPRFFADRPVRFSVAITGTDAHHIRDVLRLHIGETIEVVDSNGDVFDIEIIAIGPDEVTGKVVGRYEVVGSLPEVYLFQSLPKAGKLDTIIRQVTEIGADGIFPFISERAISKVEGEKAGKKLERWQKIATEAAKQSHRTIIPRVNAVLSWKQALDELRGFDLVVLFWEEETLKLPFEVLDSKAQRIAVVIGPEGGFSEKEARELIGMGARVVSMGDSILRVETAAPVAIALVLYDLRRIQKAKREGS
ncbi:MAG: 16S rRNA (uracil(1498)-N(3))-methyltransferase [Rubrobacteridae bacterium]|nr:16S rRNA (uracil(1498)-N(3))-methyltransferase [Rubrobacteridae bacterium]